jgi:hypothetical protein
MRWVVSHGRFNHRKKCWCPLNCRLGGPQGVLNPSVKREICYPFRESFLGSSDVQPVTVLITQDNSSYCYVLWTPAAEGWHMQTMANTECSWQAVVLSYRHYCAPGVQDCVLTREEQVTALVTCSGNLLKTVSEQRAKCAWTVPCWNRITDCT